MIKHSKGQIKCAKCKKVFVATLSGTLRKHMCVPQREQVPNYCVQKKFQEDDANLPHVSETSADVMTQSTMDIADAQDTGAEVTASTTIQDAVSAAKLRELELESRIQGIREGNLFTQDKHVPIYVVEKNGDTYDTYLYPRYKKKRKEKYIYTEKQVWMTVRYDSSYGDTSLLCPGETEMQLVTVRRRRKL
tara:strand:+ start:4968 stop:5540 length:573 start_codon:yes stop_codon:yes gene_type:complete